VRRLAECLYSEETGRLHRVRSRSMPIPNPTNDEVRLHCVGLLWNWRAAWVGLHHSAKDRRTCVNLIPFLTIWYTRPGGMLP
jgi:hypothetical protein